MTTTTNNQIADNIAYVPEYAKNVQTVVDKFNDDIMPFLKKFNDYIVVKGMQYYTTNPKEKRDNPVIQRTRSVQLKSLSKAYINNVRYYMGDDMPVLNMPTITWAGTGGYWYTATINQDFLNINNINYSIPEEIYELHLART